MPKVHFVKKARKSNKKLGIVRGLPYWWWTGPKPRVHGKRGRRIVSLAPPRPSQVTSNAYLKRCLTIKESVLDASKNGGLADVMLTAAYQFGALAEEEAAKFENLPASLKDSRTGQLLQDRAKLCDELAESLRDEADLESDASMENINWEF